MVEVAKSVLADMVLPLGSMEQTVEVVGGAKADLQTVDSSIGDVVGGNAIVQLPTTQRRASQLLYLQVGAQTTFGAGGNTRGGGIAGARSDQNVFTPDGVDISEPEMGGIIGQIGPGMSVPVEAMEEFRATSINATIVITGLLAFIWVYFGRLYLIHDSEEWRIANQELGYPLYIIPLIGVTHILRWRGPSDSQCASID